MDILPAGSDLVQRHRCGSRFDRERQSDAFPSLECIPGAECAPGRAHRSRRGNPAELARRCRGPAHARCVALACAQGGKRLACLQGPNPRVDRAAPRGVAGRHARLTPKWGVPPVNHRVSAPANTARAAPSFTAGFALRLASRSYAAGDSAVALPFVRNPGGLTGAPRLPGSCKTSMFAERARRRVQSYGEASTKRGV
jgi:hypothetical protein